MIRAALIGLGDIAPVHMGAIRAAHDAELVAGCDIDSGRRLLLPDETPFYTDYAEMMDREKIDVVHLCLPHYLHYPVAKEAAKKRINILVEKPLALNVSESKQLARLEEEFGVKVCVCLQNRYNHTSKKLVELLKSGEYGDVKGVTGIVAWSRTKEYYDAKPWRSSMELAGGGVMMNQAIHTLDLLQYFVMNPVCKIRGSVTNLLDFDLAVEDTATAHIFFESGATGLFLATVANSADSSVQIEVRCDKADFIIQNKALHIVERGNKTLLAEDSDVVEGKACYGDSHHELIDQFYRVLENTGGSYIPAEQGIASVRMIEAVRKSSCTGQAVIWEASHVKL